MDRRGSCLKPWGLAMKRRLSLKKKLRKNRRRLRRMRRRRRTNNDCCSFYKFPCILWKNSFRFTGVPKALG